MLSQNVCAAVGGTQTAAAKGARPTVTVSDRKATSAAAGTIADSRLAIR